MIKELSEKQLQYYLTKVKNFLKDENNSNYITGIKDDLKRISKNYASLISNHFKNIIDHTCTKYSILSKEKTDLIEAIEKAIIKSRLRILENKVRDGVNIGLDLIDILNDEDFKNQIHEKAKNALYSSGIQNPEIIFISLSLIALEKYDGSFYPHVNDCYGKDTKPYENKIRKIAGSYYKKFQDNSRPINSIISNAIIPKNYLPEFFKFIYTIFKVNFETAITIEKDKEEFIYRDLYSNFEQIYEEIGKTIADSDGDEFKFNIADGDDSNKPNSCTLIKSTKELMGDKENRHSIILLSMAIIKIIEKEYYKENNELQYILNPYLQYGFDEWLKTNPLLRENKREQGEKRDIGFRANWKPEFFYDGKDVYLVPLEHFIKEDYEYPEDIYITVTENGKEIYKSNKHNTYKLIVGNDKQEPYYKLIHKRIPINNPLNKIRYNISDSYGNVLYNSRDELFRKYIVFGRKADIDGREIYNNSDYEGFARVCCQNDIPDNWNIETENEYYKIAGDFVAKGDCINIGDEFFNFSRMIKPRIQGKVMDNFSVEFEGEKIPVYKNVICAIFESPDNISHHDIVIDGKNCREISFRKKIDERTGVSMYRISLEGLEAGLHTLKISNSLGRRHEKISLPDKFFLDPKVEQKYHQHSENSYTINIESSFSEARISKKIDISELGKSIDIEFKCDERDFIYHIPLKFKMYRIIDNGKEGVWRSYGSTINPKDISSTSVIQLCGIDADKISVYNDKNRKLFNDDIRLTDKDGFLVADIGSINDFKYGDEFKHGDIDFVRLDIKNRSSVVQSIKCFMRGVINRVTLNYDKNKSDFSINCYFNGTDTVSCSVNKKDKNNNLIELFKIENIKSNTDCLCNGKISTEGTYVFKFFEKVKKGLSLKNKDIKSYQKIFPNLNDIQDSYYYIHKFIIDYGEEKIDSRYPNNYSYSIKFTKIDSYGKCKGYLFMRNKKKNIPWTPLKDLNPVNVEFLQISEVLNEYDESPIDIYDNNNYKNNNHFRINLNLDERGGILLDTDELKLIENEENDDTERLDTLPDVFEYEISPEEYEVKYR